MDLRNQHITMRELLENPAARAVLERRFPEAVKLPIVAVSGSLTLERAVKLAAAYVSPADIQRTLDELEAL